MKLCIHDYAPYLVLISFAFALYKFVLLYALLCDVFIVFEQTILILMSHILIIGTRKS